MISCTGTGLEIVRPIDLITYTALFPAISPNVLYLSTCIATVIPGFTQLASRSLTNASHRVSAKWLIADFQKQ